MCRLGGSAELCVKESANESDFKNVIFAVSNAYFLILISQTEILYVI